MYIPRFTNVRKMRSALDEGYTIHLRDANGVTLATIGITNGMMVITTIPPIGVPMGHLLHNGTRLARRMLWHYQRLHGVRQVVILNADDQLTNYHLTQGRKVLHQVNHLLPDEVIDYDVDWRLCTSN